MGKVEEPESPFDGITQEAWQAMLADLEKLYGKYRDDA